MPAAAAVEPLLLMLLLPLLCWRAVLPLGPERRRRQNTYSRGWVLVNCFATGAVGRAATKQQLLGHRLQGPSGCTIAHKGA